jgi:hypothetical protein
MEFMLNAGFRRTVEGFLSTCNNNSCGKKREMNLRHSCPESE